MRSFASNILFACLALLLVVAAPAAAFEQSELVVRSGGQAHTFRVELARTPDERSRGLMFRRQMDADAGMLFDFGRNDRHAMWMKNTFIPLDMLFIREDGIIHRIAERTVPQSETVIPSGGRVRAVLELNGGTAERLGIKPGDVVVHGMFGNAQ